MNAPFVHLHVHSEYSLLESTLTTRKIVALAAELGMPAVALSDRNNLFGAVEFFSEAKAKGIAPIIGCELNVLVEGGMTERSGKRGQDLAHLILLVQNEKGYANLCHLLSEAYLKGFYYKPRVDIDALSRYADGLIALSGCFHGVIADALVKGQNERASALVARLAPLYPDRFYIELQRNGRGGEAKINRELVKLARNHGLPLVATNDCHYAARESSAAQEVLLCIDSGKTLNDFDHDQMPSEEFYFKGGEEMADLFQDLPEAVENTAKIAARCTFAFDFKTYHFPKFEVPRGETLETVLHENAMQGLDALFRKLPPERVDTDEKKKTYRERLNTELDVICKMGFAGYFLIVADFIRYAKDRGIPVGPGRGSAAGSLVAYALGITALDPLPYNLLFERFLNPERISMPDVDIDFCIRGRAEVIQYVAQKYGSVSQIITFGKMKAKAVIRDVARVLNFPYADADKIAKLVPNALNITLEDALKQEPRLKALMKEDPKVNRLISLAIELEGLCRHASTHAAGVVISDRALSELAPLYKGSNEDLVTQFDMKAVEKIGLIKFDFLGLKTLTILADTVESIRRTRGSAPDLERIPLDDKPVYETLARGDALGIFQLESSGMRELIVKLVPSTFEDLVALVALYRPGPLGSGMVDDFIDRKHGRKEASYPLPQLEPILKDTYGVIVYQEQVMQIAATLASYSLGEADLLRRAMGKKKPEEMAAQKKRFLEGAATNKIPAKKAEFIFDLMAKFAEYGFNKSHSAAYALVAYQTATLKTHFRTEYMATLMSFELSDTDKILDYIRDCKREGIEVLPPDINTGEWRFSPAGDKRIRYGLGAIKNVGAIAIDAIIANRTQEGPFKDLYDLGSRVDLSKVNRRVLESLIRAGACDGFGDTRKSMENDLDRALEMGTKLQSDRLVGQTSLFDVFGSAAEDTRLLSDANPSLAATHARNEWNEGERLSKEKEVLGFYLSGHPLSEYRDFIARLALPAIATLHNKANPPRRGDAEVHLSGVITGVKEIQTKAGKRMAFASLEDFSGRIEVVIFADLYQDSHELFKGDAPLVVSGRLDAGEESTKLVASRAMTLDAYHSQKTKSVHVHLPAGITPNGALGTLKSLLQECRGPCPTYIHYVEAGKWESVIRLPDDYAVSPSPTFVRRLNALLGEGEWIRFDINI